MKEKAIRNLSDNALLQFYAITRDDLDHFLNAQGAIPKTSILGSMAIAASIKRCEKTLLIIRDEFTKRNIDF